MNEKTVKQLAEEVRNLFRDLDENVVRFEMSAPANVEIEYSDSDEKISKIITEIPEEYP